jgi:ComF family protein
MTHLAACQVLTGYEGAIRTLLHGLKFQRRRGNAAPLAWLVSMADEAELAELPLGKGIVVPVPVSTMRREERGYNQVDLIFGDWCRRQGMKWEPDILVRQRSTLPQWELDRQGRNDNIKGAFVVNAPAKINRHPIILVDDIVTTGRTLEECALVLRKAGAASVHALALANGSANLRH